MFAVQALLNLVVSSVVLWVAARFLFAYTALPSIVVGDLAKALSSMVAATLSFLILRSVVFRGTKTKKRVVRINILGFAEPLNSVPMDRRV
jgi:hypothetical protein